MEQIDGFHNEFQIASYLNNKKVGDLNLMYKNYIYDIFDNITDDDIVSAKIDFNEKKYDMILCVNNIKKLVSIKMGINNSVHVEGISSFIHFLIDSGVSRDSVIEYLRYHYADGTLNGTGKVRISGEEYKKDNQDKIDKINLEINNEYILTRAINRFVLQGKNSNQLIDVILYGTRDDILWLKRNDVYKVILDNKNIYSTGIHFGQLYCQPMTRNLNNNKRYDKKRFCIQIKWYSLFKNIMLIMNERSN